ncbi:hypothetical protein [Gracilimonas mengyeensis]|uniref:Uncharacterized protein n=1 Tax=Gracilimonas mengyeensis TaxID=1302730 RepID=A0A521CX28_9BACT|nr:hypothetical protein [Gracilimonas mengyeensis]SMO64016.1 hypothetical protein SAMN06265219_106200 [Gracilimonas mengyeensis]
MDTLKNSASHQKLIHTRNIIAAVSSIIPGLGHVYKGYFASGFGLILVSPFIIWVGAIAAFGTLGFGIFIPLAYMIFIGWHAYNLEDHRHHHPGGIL